MTDLTMLGLGEMGAAIARGFVEGGHSLTVWNRTASKTEPLVASGAMAAGSVAEAISASDRIVICVDDYSATMSILVQDDVGQLLSGKTVVQFSTGSPADAEDLESFVTGFGGAYLDAAFMEYPAGVGAEATQILLAGPESAYTNCKPYLDCLGGDIRYLGSNCSAAAALDLALLTCNLCDYLGAYHGSLICEAHGISVDSLTSLLPQMHPAREITEAVHADSYMETGAPISGWKEAVETIQTHASENNINREIPDFISEFIGRAIAAGYGDEDITAIIKILRK